MTLKPSLRRRIASTSSGALLIGAGMSVGLLTADNARHWSEQIQLAADAQTSPIVGEPTLGIDRPRPVIVTRVKERHVTPDPVIVHRKVSGSSGGQASSRITQPRSTSTRTRTKSRPTRTTIAPAPAAPRPAPKPAPAKSTSKAS